MKFSPLLLLIFILSDFLNVVQAQTITCNDFELLYNPTLTNIADTVDNLASPCSYSMILRNLEVTPKVEGATYIWKKDGSTVKSGPESIYTATTAGIFSAMVTLTGCTSEIPTNVTTVTIRYIATTCRFWTNYSPVIYNVGTNLSVTSTLPGFRYQWFKKGLPIEGATLPGISNISNYGDYSVRVGISCCGEKYSIGYNGDPGCIYPENTFRIIRTNNNLGLSPVPSTSTFQWMHNDTEETGQTGYLHTNTLREGSYKIRITKSGCSFVYESESKYILPITDVVTITTYQVSKIDDCPLSTLKNPDNNEISIWPNPSEGLFNIDYPADIIADNLEIFNAEGKPMEVQRDFKAINLKNFLPGFYLLKLHTSKGIFYKKLLIQRI